MGSQSEREGVDAERFRRQLQALRAQLTRLRQRAGDAAATGLDSDVLAELGVTLEALRAAEEDLREQAEALQVQHALLEAEHRRYQDLFELAPEGYLVTDREGVIREANQATSRLLNRDAAHLLGKPLASFVAAHHSADFDQHVEELARLGGPRRWQCQLLPLDRPPVDVECTVAPGHNSAPSGPAELRWHLYDITDRMRAEAERQQSRQNLRDLSARLEAVREEERSRMAREVHDELGSTLTAIKMDVAAARQALSRARGQRNQQALARVAAASDMIDQTMHSIRRIAMEMRPAVLDDLGLVAALDWQLTEFQKRTGLECILNVAPGSAAVEPTKATAVFRIFQEILTNIARHAQANRVEVRLFQAGPDLVLEVRDNGRGLSPEAASGTQSLGLLGMQERARLHGGTVEFKGSAGPGTQVRVTIPVAPAT